VPTLAFEAWLEEDDATVRDDVEEFDKLVFALVLALK